MTSPEYLPITPIPFFSDRPVEIAVLWVVKEDTGGLAYVSPPVTPAGTPFAMGKLVLRQLHLYQDCGPAAILKLAPQDYVDSRCEFIGARPFSVDLAEQMPRGDPFKDESIDIQLLANQIADTSGKALQSTFPKGQKKVESKHLRAEEMSDVIVQHH